MHHFTRQSASFHVVKYGRLRNDLHQLILPLFINIITTPNKLIRHYKYPDMQRLRRSANIQIDVFAMMNVLNPQRRRCYVGIAMNIFYIINVTMTQRHRYYVDIPMNVFDIINAFIAQRRRCYVGIPMNVFGNINALISQLGTSCSFDSPGLARNEPTPGQRSQGDSTP